MKKKIEKVPVMVEVDYDYLEELEKIKSEHEELKSRHKILEEKFEAYRLLTGMRVECAERGVNFEDFFKKSLEGIVDDPEEFMREANKNAAK